MAWIPAAIAAGGAIISAVSRGSASGKASKAAQNAAKDANQIQKAQDAKTDARLLPWLDAGKAALNEQRKQLGLPAFNADAQDFVPTRENLKPVPNQGGKHAGQYFYDPGTGQGYIMSRQGVDQGQFNPTQTQYPDLIDPEIAAKRKAAKEGTGTADTTGGRYGAFETTPGYLFRYDEGQKAVMSANAARGRAYSGAQLRSATRYASGLASQEYDAYYNRLANLSGTGANETNVGINAGQYSADNRGTNAYVSGASRASSISSQADNWGQALGGLANIFGDYAKSRTGGASGSVNDADWWNKAYNDPFGNT